jgi:hypothetical protein
VSHPLISVVTPSFNQAAYLEQAIRSVLGQESVAVQYWIMDGGSTDGSLDIIRSHVDRLAGWISEADSGQAEAINKGWARSTGEVLAWLNSDDWYCPGALRLVAEEFAAHPDMLILAGDCLMADAAGRPIGRKAARTFDTGRMLLTGGDVPGQPAVFIRRSVYESVGPLRTDLHYTLDFEYWLRASLRWPPEQTRCIHVPLAAVRQWPGAKTQRGVQAISEEHRRILDDYFADSVLPEALRARRAEAYAGAHWKQASLEWQAGQGGAGAGERARGGAPRAGRLSARPRAALLARFLAALSLFAPGSARLVAPAGRPAGRVDRAEGMIALFETTCDRPIRSA